MQKQWWQNSIFILSASVANWFIHITKLKLIWNGVSPFLSMLRRQNRPPYLHCTKLDVLSIEPSVQHWARHQAWQYIHLALGCSFWAQREYSISHSGHAKALPARFWAQLRAHGFEFDIFTTPFLKIKWIPLPSFSTSSINQTFLHKSCFVFLLYQEICRFWVLMADVPGAVISLHWDFSSKVLVIFFSGSLRKGSVEQRRVQVRLGYSAEACSGADGRGSVWQRRVQVRLG